MGAHKATFTLPDTILNELALFAEELGEKKSHLVSDALSQYFDTLDLKLARKRSEEVRSAEVETVSFDEIKREIGLE